MSAPATPIVPDQLPMRHVSPLPDTRARQTMAWPQAASLVQLTRHNKTLSTVYVNAAHIVRFERSTDDITTQVWLADKHGTVLEVEELPEQIGWAMTGGAGS